MIAALDAGGVDISQLPPADEAEDGDTATDTAASTEGATATAPAPKPAIRQPAAVARPAPAPRPAAAPPPRATARSTATSKDPSKSAMSGSRAAQLAAINAYKAKRTAGTLTEKEARLLRALCRQHGVTDCSN
jgi:hypothetical protein